MNIVVFSPYYPPHIGGLEKHAEEFNQQLIKSKKIQKIWLVTSNIPRSLSVVEEINASITILRLPTWEIISGYPIPKFWTYGFWKVIKKLPPKPDIIISRTRFFLTSYIAYTYSKLSRATWVHIEHGSDHPKFDNKFISAIAYIYDSTLGRLIFKKSSINIAISEAVRRFIEKYDQRTCPVIRRGFDIDKIISIQPNTQYNNKKLKIVFAGRLVEGKGVIYLLKALTMVDRDDYECIIIGSGPQRSALKTFIEDNKLTHRVNLIGAKQWSTTVSIIKKADIFINPSLTEGLPSSVIEAALCKKAIIATNVGGTSEIITEGISGFLVPPKAPVVIADKINELGSSEQKRTTLGINAFNEVTANFSWEKSINQYLNIFDEEMDKSCAAYPAK